MMVLKWICFILVCMDTIAYIIERGKRLNGVGSLIALCLGIAARVYVLYGATAYWLLA